MPVAALAFSPNGRLLASASFDDTVKLWEVGSWRCLATFSGMQSLVGVAFSPDSQRLVTASDPVKLWDLRSFEEVGSLPVTGAVAWFSPDSDGIILAVLDTSKILHLWRAPPLRECRL
jgi:WD40 repeat protein